MPSPRCTGIEMVTLENGCVCRSLHGGLRREHQRNYNYMYYGDFVMMETDRFPDQPLVNVYREGDKFCRGSWKRYAPTPRIQPMSSEAARGHMGSDYYSTHFFIEKILGRPDGMEWSIDVYQAVERGICGLLAHRSSLRGGEPQAVPNFRNKEERDAYRDDNDTAFPDLEHGDLVPAMGHPLQCTPDSTYFNYVRSLWEDSAKLMEE